MTAVDSKSCRSIFWIVLLMLGAAVRLDAQQRLVPATEGGVRFEQNLGQIFDMQGRQRPDLLFTASSGGVKVFLRKTGISYLFIAHEPKNQSGAGDMAPAFPTVEPQVVRGYRMDMDLIGANPDPVVEHGEPSSDYINHYISSLPHGITGVRFYRLLTYRDIYPDIDMVLRSTDSGMKCDFLVHPGGRVSDIRIRHTAADSVVLTAFGGVMIATPLGYVVEQAPFSFSGPAGEVAPDGTSALTSTLNISGENVSPDDVVPSRYRLDQGILTFEVGSYDTTRTLVIDPLRMWSSFVGGSNHDYSLGGNPVAIDAEENVLLTGLGQFPDFPVSPGAFQSATATSSFVIKMDPAGNRLWATMFGGIDPALHVGIGHAIVADNDLNVYFAGFAWGGGFPVTADAFQRDPGGGYDGYLAKLDSDGNRVWATYYGGVGDEAVFGLALDNNSDLVLAASTSSSGMGTPGTFQPTRSAGTTSKALVAKFTANGRRLWATYCGGSSDDQGFAVDVDSRRNILVTGWTTSSDFPVSTGAHQSALSGFADAFILKLDATGNRKWATYYGGTGIDNHWMALWSSSSGVEMPLGNPNSAFCAIAVDPSDAVLITGITDGGFPTTPGAAQTTFAGAPNDGYVAKFDSNGVRLWSTYMGGNYYDAGGGIVSRPDGSILVTGFTWSTDMRVTADALQGANAGLADIWLARYSSGGALEWGSYYGGAGYDLARGIASHAHGAFVMAGYTLVAGYPTTPGVFQTQSLNAGAFDAVLAVFCDALKPVVLTPAALTVCPGDSVTLTGPAGYRSYLWSNGATTRAIVAKQSGDYTLSVTSLSGCVAVSDIVPVVVRTRRRPVVTPSGPTTLCFGESVRLDVSEAFSSYDWSNGLKSGSILVNRSGIYRVMTIDENGCRDSSASIEVIVRARPDLRLDSGATATICEGESITIAPTLPFSSYRWSSGETTAAITARNSGDYTLTVTDEDGCEASATITVTVAPTPAPRITLSGSADLCEGDTLILQTDEGYAAYRWSTGEMGSSIRVTTAGIYSVMATGVGGCTGESEQVQIELMPAPAARITGPSSICPLSSATYSVAAQPGVRYAWSVEGSDGSITGSSSDASAIVRWAGSGGGEVRVTVTDDITGCSSESILDVTIGSALVPVVTIDGPAILCDGGSLTLDAGPGYTSYLWSNGATTRSISVTMPDIYVVTVRDASGCSGDSEPITITAGSLPAPVIGYTGTPLLCPGGSIELDAGEYSAYLWSNGASTRTIVVGTAGEYSVTVTDDRGCSASSSVLDVILQSAPAPVIDGPGSVCINSTATYCVADSAGHSYDWNVSGGTILSGSGTSCVTIAWDGAGAGEVGVSQSSPTTGCSGEAERLPVTIGTTISPAITTSGPTRICQGESVTLSAPSGYRSYLWNTGETARTITVGTAGRYTVTIDADGGCSGSADVEISVSPRPVPIVTPAGSITICQGDSTTLSAAPGFAIYRWSSGEGTRSITVRDAGIYELEVTDSEGCSGSSEQIVVIVNPAPAPPRVTTSGDTLFSSPATSYQWLLDGKPIDGATEQHYIQPAGGNYSVRITDASGCTALSAAGAASTLSLARIDAIPGERISMPLELLSSRNLEAFGLDSYTATIRFDRTLLLPVGTTPMGRIEGSERVVNISGTRQAGSATGTLATLEFLVTLGERSETPVRIESFNWNSGDAELQIHDGSVRIMQEDGCERFIAVGSELLRISPNPSSGITRIQFETIESGPTTLELLDIRGRPVATVLHAERKAEAGTAEIDLSSLATGTYYLVLRTSNTQAVQQVVVVR